MTIKLILGYILTYLFVKWMYNEYDDVQLDRQFSDEQQNRVLNCQKKLLSQNKKKIQEEIAQKRLEIDREKLKLQHVKVP